MSKPIIEVRGLSKRYKLGVFNAKTLREEAEAFLSRFSRKNAQTADGLRHTAKGGAHAASGLVTSNPPPVTAEPSAEFWALRDVSFDVQPGEVIGVIGRNGAGKSTLLKILSRITEPTSGEARIRGRVASLLEVGTGFHPELTGRENIFLNGAILGMTKQEIRNKFDEIVAFAEIEKFIDTPVKRYSSGMYVRLAFAVAAHLEPEILIVDEVLAVGDFEFQKKCLGKMKDVAGHGRTVLFVSHNMAAVQVLCTKGILLRSGQVAALGDVGQVIHDYVSKDSADLPFQEWSSPELAPGNENIRLKSVRVTNRGEVRATLDICQPVHIEVEFWNLTPAPRAWAGVQLRDAMGGVVFVSINRGSTAEGEDTYREQPLDPGVYRSVLTIPANFLNETEYRVLAAVQRQATHFEAVTPEDITFRTSDSGRMRAEFKGHWDGLVRPLLPWRTEKVANLSA